MKSVIWAIVILIVALGVILECRYMLIVNSPIVAKIDRFTGDVWIANAGVWRKVQLPTQGKAEMGGMVSSQKAAQAK